MSKLYVDEIVPKNTNSTAKIDLSNNTVAFTGLSSTQDFSTVTATNGTITTLNTTDISTGTINSNVVFPAGTVLQVAAAEDRATFEYYNTNSSFYWGTPQTRGDNSHAGVASGLNVTLTTKKANSTFLLDISLPQCQGQGDSYNMGISFWWSVDSYANQIGKGDNTATGQNTVATEMSFGQWNPVNHNTDRTLFVRHMVPVASTVAKGTSVTFKVCFSTHYFSNDSGRVYYNRKASNHDNYNYNMSTVATHTVTEIAT